ncbi:MAG: hypothetical protein ABSA47_18700 [Verrucomicrobiota bacterium]
MNTDSVDIQLVLFWASMAVTVAVYGVCVWSSLKPRSRTNKRS